MNKRIKKGILACVVGVVCFLFCALQAMAFSEGMCSLCLDDGYTSQYENARGPLNNYNLKGVFYIISDKMEGAESYFMNAAQVQTLASDGHEIGSHSKTHPFLTVLNEQELEDELSLSRESIISNVGVIPYSFAAPYGDYDDSTIAKVKNYYENHRTVDEGYNEIYTDPYKLKVRSVFDYTSVSEIQSWVDTAISEKSWLVILFHQIDNNPGEYHYPSSDFEYVCSYIANSGIRNVTVREGCLELNPTGPDFGGKHIIGYYPDWDVDFMDKIEYDKLTHVNYFSIEPYSNGALNTTNISPARLTQVVEAAHAAGVTVSISVGGWERSSGFPDMTSDPDARSNFVQNMVFFVNQYELDGIDLNWESVTEPDNYSTLIEELRVGLGPDKLLSVAVSSWCYDIWWYAVDDIDWVEVMAYDMNWPNAEHATYEDAVAAMSFWEALPAPKDKLVMGLPFYGRNDACDYMHYDTIIDTYNPLPSEDWAGGYFFNGIDTIQAKTTYVYENDYAGVMMWTLSYDKQDDMSLLAAIASKASEYSTDPTDTTPPSPDPMTWVEAPNATGDTSISMTATTATDPSGLEYYFACTSGQPEGDDSGWQDSPSYTDTGLEPNTTYSYEVKARDKSANQNETGWSVAASATTTGGTVATTLHVDDISLSLVKGSRGARFAKATVLIKDNLGDAVPLAKVTGTFTGDFNEQFIVTTDNNGQAVFVTAAQVKRPSFTFTVDNVTHATLIYNPADNVETSDSR